MMPLTPNSWGTTSLTERASEIPLRAAAAIRHAMTTPGANPEAARVYRWATTPGPEGRRPTFAQVYAQARRRCTHFASAEGQARLRRALQQVGYASLLREANDCHNPGGTPAGGQFCSKGGSTGSMASLLTDRYEGDLERFLNEWQDPDYRTERYGGEPWTSEMETTFNTDSYMDVLQRLGLKPEEHILGNETVYRFTLGKKDMVLEDGEVTPKEAESWINDLSEDRAILLSGLGEHDFSKEFWDGPGPLYHATSEDRDGYRGDNVRSILKTGIGARKESRGLANRSVGAAVFTSDDPEWSAIGDYGTAVFEIDTARMKRDGYMPRVDREEGFLGMDARSALAHRLGLDRYEPQQEDTSLDPRTVVVFGHIPAKYVSLFGTVVHQRWEGKRGGRSMATYRRYIRRFGGRRRGLREFNKCHNPGGSPAGGQFCSTGPTTTLYRGDSADVTHALAKSDPRALFGAGIYLTDSKVIAGDYTVKGGEGIIFSRDGGTKAEAISAYIRSQAMRVDLTTGKVEHYQSSMDSVVGQQPWGRATAYDSVDKVYRSPTDLKRIEIARALWAKESKGIQIRRLADGRIVFQQKARRGVVSTFDVPQSWLKRTVDAEAEISDRVAEALLSAIRSGSRSSDNSQLIKEIARATEQRDEEGYRPTFRTIYRTVSAMAAEGGPGLFDDRAQQTFRRELKALGYKGIRYEGGLTMGGRRHTAYVFWDEQGLKKRKARPSVRKVA